MMFPYLFTNLDFAGLFRFVSPQFFKVISPAALFKIAPKLKKNYSDGATWDALRKRTLRKIEKAHFPAAKNSGEDALRLFFFQILTEETWILDFRAEAFSQPPGEELIWNPKPLYYAISPAFLGSVREMYRGFYLGDEALFDHALVELGLEKAKDCLRTHFGQGDQTKVDFQLQTFQNTFADVFQVCEREGLTLQTEFFILGLMLLTLYQNLESHHSPQNARKCFTEAWEKASKR
jgi:hypothetical protein